MKTGASLEYFKNLSSKKLENLEEMGKFLVQPKLHQEVYKSAK
jgi:hypothetical protein